ncbi:hypothetical protein OR1_02497 [Geobacter sp. OR-1]|uniref:DUF4340 domain-containing protein n=1 Tax=Geobacter sp. OR-1 TaxID=1266765 RepID=UPI000541F26D|nr:DUF4340 domain-containing protein [Geobacter sp. OR-1]GAM10209.1 hypothetical protein OR1_02497 [Geobacter sp. OR-1]
MRFRGTAVLVAITLLLGGFYLLYQRPQAEAKKAALAFEKRFFRADSGAISSIIIENWDGVVEISHGADGWMIERPQRYRPDDGMIRKLLETIAKGELTKVVGEASELNQFGFDRPVLSLTIRTGQSRDMLMIGQKNPTDTGYYAYSEGLGKIFLVNKELPKDLYLRLYDLREKRLYPALRFEDIGRVVISRGKEKLDIAFDGKVWRMRAPFDVMASAEEVKAFLGTLTGQKAAAFIPWEKGLAKLPQQMHLQLFDLNGRPVVDNRVYYLGTGEDEGVVIHAAGNGESIRTHREFWEILQIDPADLMERRLFPRDSAGITRVSVFTGNEQIVLVRNGNQWEKNGRRVDAEKVRIILDTMRNWKTSKRAPEKEHLGKTRTGIEVNYAGEVERLMITEKEISRSMSTELPTMHAESKDIIYFLASSSALGQNVLVLSNELDRFLGQMRQLK